MAVAVAATVAEEAGTPCCATTRDSRGLRVSPAALGPLIRTQVTCYRLGGTVGVNGAHDGAVVCCVVFCFFGVLVRTVDLCN